MKIREVLDAIEAVAPLSRQEEWDNAGVQVGDTSRTATGVLLSLDVTEEVLDEAIAKGCNLVIAHHPLLFRPLRSVQGASYTERCLIKAVKQDVTVYAAHTNLDNVRGGVNFRLAEMLGLQDVRILRPQQGAEEAGSGAIGRLPAAISAPLFLQGLKEAFSLQSIRHSVLPDKPIETVAVCGGSGAFLIPDALAAGADVFITGEARYNDFYDVEGRLLLAVVGHYESEVCTKDIFHRIISKKFPTFAVYLSDSHSNPVIYL